MLPSTSSAQIMETSTTAREGGLRGVLSFPFILPGAEFAVSATGGRGRTTPGSSTFSVGGRSWEEEGGADADKASDAEVRVLLTASWKALAKAAIEGKRSSGCFASARLSTASRAGGMAGLKVLGTGGGAVRCWNMISPVPPIKGGRPVSISYAITASAY